MMKDEGNHMDSLFENQTTYTHKLFMETQSESYRKYHRASRMLLLVLSVVCMLGALFCLGVFAANKDAMFLAGSIALFVLCIIFFYLYFNAYRIRANTSFKSNRALCPTGEHSYSVFSDRIELTTSQTHQTILFEQITRIFETENTCCFMVKKTFFFIEKNGFTQGNYAGFSELLKKSCGKLFQ